jgi:hypothetical protein
MGDFTIWVALSLLNLQSRGYFSQFILSFQKNFPQLTQVLDHFSLLTFSGVKQKLTH